MDWTEQPAMDWTEQPAMDWTEQPATDCTEQPATDCTEQPGKGENGGVGSAPKSIEHNCSNTVATVPD